MAESIPIAVSVNGRLLRLQVHSDRRLLDDRISSLRSALPQGIDLSYAVKANLMPAVVQHLASLVEIGLVLFIITLMVNSLSRLLIWSMARSAAAPATQPAEETAEAAA